MDVNDLTIVLAHFDQTFGVPPGGDISAVPEPSSLPLVVVPSTQSPFLRVDGAPVFPVAEMLVGRGVDAETDQPGGAVA